MQEQHVKSLENLSFFCHFCGLLPTFLGILIIFIDVINEAFDHVPTGLFMFITGYAQVKISEKLDAILKREKFFFSGEVQAKQNIPV